MARGRDRRRLHVLVIHEAQDALHDSIGYLVCMSCQDLTIKIQKPGFDDAGNRIWVNFRKGVILAHVGGDAARVKRKACGALITVHETGCEAAGAVGIARVKRRGYFKACGLVINKIARVVVDGNQCRPHDSR